MPLDESARLEALEGAEINQAKIILANEATALCHGSEAAKAAEQTATQTFAKGEMADGLPQITLTSDEAIGLSVVDAFLKLELGASKGEVRRLIKGGGARINGAAIANEDVVLSGDDFADGKCQLSAGKKRHALIILA